MKIEIIKLNPIFMRKLIAIICFCGIFFSANAQTETVEIKTSAICEMCKYTIEKDLAFEKGVKSSDLDVESRVVTVQYNAKKTNPEIIRKRITMIGYHADSLHRDAKAYSKLPDCCKDGAHGRPIE